MLGMDKDKYFVVTGKYAEELRDAIRHKYEVGGNEELGEQEDDKNP